MNLKLLVVGGTGFIGYHVAKRAISKGFDVYSISRNRPVHLREVKGVNYKFLDLLNYEDLRKFLHNKKIDYVINTSGCINHTLFKDGGNHVFRRFQKFKGNYQYLLIHLLKLPRATCSKCLKLQNNFQQ